MRTAEKKMMDYCTYCPKMCRFACPVSEATKTETYTPWGKMQIARWLTEKKLPLSSETVLPLYQCTNCLHCQVYCEHDNDVPEALRMVRKLAIANYAAPDSVFQVGKNFSQHNNPYEMDIYKKGRVPGLSEWANKKADVLFFPSCHTVHHFPKRLNTYRELFQKLNIQNITLLKEPLGCCGEPLRALGFEQEFRELAEVQYFSLKKFSHIVTDDGECCVSLRDHYGNFGFRIKSQVVHLLEFLEPYLKHSNYRTQGKVKGRVVFHDPPFLSRYLHLSELPRKLIAHVSGFFPTDLHMKGEDTLSSGTEGSYDRIFPEISEKIARRTLREIEGKRIKKLVTACAKTETQFRRLSKAVEVQDIYEFLNEQILLD